MRKTDAFLRTRKVFDTADLCGRGAQGARTNRGERAPTRAPCHAGHRVYVEVVARAPHYITTRTGGHPSRLFMRGGVTPC